MQKHKTFKFDKFISSVDNDLLIQFFQQKGLSLDKNNDPAISDIAKSIESIIDPEHKMDIWEDMQSINDIADHTMEMLVQAVKQHRIPCEEDDSPETIAMRIYLLQKQVFDIIHDSFLQELYAENLNHFSFENCSNRFDLDKIDLFKKQVEAYYKAQRKSENCLIRERLDGDKHCFFIARGDHMKTISIFKDKQLKTTSIRPGKEDMLLFDNAKAVLSIRTSGRGLEEKHKYIEIFGTTLLGLPKIAEETYNKTLVLLSPIREQSFYSGNKDIATVKLVQVSLKQKANERVKMILKSDDIFESLDDMELSLDDYNLVWAKLRFFFHENRRPITVEIKPPGNTKIKKRREKEMIENYLREKHVLLA